MDNKGIEEMLNNLRRPCMQQREHEEEETSKKSEKANTKE